MVLTMALTAFYALTLLLYDPWFISKYRSCKEPMNLWLMH